MKNRWQLAYLIIFLLGILVFLYSVWEIIFQDNVLFISISLYLILIGIAVIIYYLYTSYLKRTIDSIQIFKKTLEGGLFHFKCPHCQGYFAVKESMYKANVKTIITCPDCGKLGMINPSSPIIYDIIPEKKSMDVKFKCAYCGESLKIWAEGTDLYPILKVFCCPFCGKNKPLKKI